MKRLKNTAIALLAVACLLAGPAEAAGQELSLEAQAVLLVEESSGAVLYEKDAHLPMYPASTTKILTALLAVELGDLAAQVTVGAELNLVAAGSSLAHLSQGDTISLGDLLYGLLLPSGNDAAYVIAAFLAREQQENPELPAGEATEVFAAMMNERARQLGARDSHFSNPDGFHAADHYTTAYDLSLIAREAMGSPFLRSVFATKSYTSDTWQGKGTRAWKNNNQLIQPGAGYYYPPATGLKTGYTGPAGFCLVSSATSGGLDLIAVALNASEKGRWGDAWTLLDYGFANYARRELVRKGSVVETVPIVNGDWGQPQDIPLAAAQSYAAVLAKEDLERVEMEVQLDPHFLAAKEDSGAAAQAYSLQAPLAVGQAVGQVVYSLEGQALFTTDLLAQAAATPLPWWRSPTALLLFAAVLGGTLLVLAFRRRFKAR